MENEIVQLKPPKKGGNLSLNTQKGKKKSKRSYPIKKKS